MSENYDDLLSEKNQVQSSMYSVILNFSNTHTHTQKNVYTIVMVFPKYQQLFSWVVYLNIICILSFTFLYIFPISCE
jgi:hypothetical protein